MTYSQDKLYYNAIQLCPAGRLEAGPSAKRQLQQHLWVGGRLISDTVRLEVKGLAYCEKILILYNFL